MKKPRQLSTPISKSNAIAEYCKTHGIPTSNGTEEMQGKTSMTFFASPVINIDDNSPSDESMDRAITSLRYHNQRKGY